MQLILKKGPEGDISGCSGCATESWGSVKEARTLHHPSGPWTAKMGHAAAAPTRWSHTGYDTAGRCPFPLLSFFRVKSEHCGGCACKTHVFVHCSVNIFLIQRQKCTNQKLRWRENIHNSLQDGSALVYRACLLSGEHIFEFLSPHKNISHSKSLITRTQ